MARVPIRVDEDGLAFSPLLPRLPLEGPYIPFSSLKLTGMSSRWLEGLLLLSPCGMGQATTISPFNWKGLVRKQEFAL